jgi:hypothetical protein
LDALNAVVIFYDPCVNATFFKVLS